MTRLLRDKASRKGKWLHLALGAANRDPEVPTEPDRSDEEGPMRRRADSLVFRDLESLPVRFD